MIRKLKQWGLKTRKPILVILLLGGYIFLFFQLQHAPRTPALKPPGDKSIRGQRKDDDSLLQEYIKKEAVKKHNRFIQSLKDYWKKDFLYYGIAFAVGVYLLLLMGLFSRYFNIRPLFGQCMKWLIAVLECLPHALLVLFFYSVVSNETGWFQVILVSVYILISIPFVYAMMADEFALAKKEGRIENLLIDPLSNWRILRSFVRENKKTLVFTPLAMLIAMMVYMDFCYSGVQVYLYEESPFRFFFGLWNSNNAHSEPMVAVMVREIWLLILLLVPLALLFYRGLKHETH